MTAATQGRSLVLIAFLVPCAAVAVAGCRRNADDVAILEQTQGMVERDDGAGWIAGSAGARFQVGDALRTGPRSRARLRVVDGNIINMAENSRVRFVRGATRVQGGAGNFVALDLGSAQIERAANEMTIVTAFGSARIEKGASVRVHADTGEGLFVEVTVGRSIVSRPDGQTPVDAGNGIRIRIGSAEVEHYLVELGRAILEPASAGSASVASGTPAPKPAPVDRDEPRELGAVAGGPPVVGEGRPAPADSLGQESSGRLRAGPEKTSRADVTLPAGDSAVLHDLSSGLAVRLRLDRLCPGAAIVDVGGRARRQERTGVETVVIDLRPGAQRYSIRCQGEPSGAKPRATGTLTLLRDSGNVRLSRRAPFNTIEADGRHYTIMFQTRLPTLSLVWPRAPADTPGVTLHLESASGARVYPASTAHRQFDSGTLPEGTYTWWYITADGKISPKTSVTIRFDNAAPTAQFFQSAPAPDDSSPNDIRIDGVTLEGAKVSVDGKPLPVDDHGRFRAVAEPSDGDDAVAVRMEHPRTGVHYYVRRRDRGAKSPQHWAHHDK
jgi:hypothetical protein